MTVASILEGWGRTVLTRKEWGSKYESVYQERRKNRAVELPVDYLYSHISVTVDDGKLTGDFISDMLELERIGYQRFKSGISYNWAIDAVTGMIGEGMPLDARGTHTVNDKNVAGFPNQLNAHGHAVVLIGMPGVKPSAEFIRSFAAIRAAEIAAGVLKANAPIYPHSKFAAKDCPTAAVRAILPTIVTQSVNWDRGDDNVALTEADRKWLSTEIRTVVRDYALWEVLYGLETEDEKEAAREAYSVARAAGKSVEEARAAATRQIQSLITAIKDAK